MCRIMGQWGASWPLLSYVRYNNTGGWIISLKLYMINKNICIALVKICIIRIDWKQMLDWPVENLVLFLFVLASNSSLIDAHTPVTLLTWRWEWWLRQFEYCPSVCLCGHLHQHSVSSGGGGCLRSSLWTLFLLQCRRKHVTGLLITMRDLFYP